MMYFKHPACDFVFRAPHGQEAHIGDLDVKRWVDPVYGPVSTSFWRPDPAELQVLIEGGSVALNIHGGGHPPVSLSVYRKEVANG